MLISLHKKKADDRQRADSLAIIEVVRWNRKVRLISFDWRVTDVRLVKRLCDSCVCASSHGACRSLLARKMDDVVGPGSRLPRPSAPQPLLQ